MHFGGPLLLDDVTLDVEPGARDRPDRPERLRQEHPPPLLAGRLEPTAGEVVPPRGVRVGYQAQELELTPGGRCMEEMRRVFRTRRGERGRPPRDRGTASPPRPTARRGSGCSTSRAAPAAGTSRAGSTTWTAASRRSSPASGSPRPPGTSRIEAFSGRRAQRDRARPGAALRPRPDAPRRALEPPRHGRRRVVPRLPPPHAGPRWSW